MVRIASATGVPCATRTSTWRSFATISSGLCLFLDMGPSSFGSYEPYLRADHFMGGGSKRSLACPITKPTMCAETHTFRHRIGMLPTVIANLGKRSRHDDVDRQSPEASTLSYPDSTHPTYP